MNSIALDTNIFLLFLVGMVNPNFISKHKRLRKYSEEDFTFLCKLLAHFDRIVITPGCIAETTNLLDHSLLAQKQFFPKLRELLHNPEQLCETYIPSIRASEINAFLWLGITDATYIDLAQQGVPVITSDCDLFTQVVAYCDRSINFDALRFS